MPGSPDIKRAIEIIEQRIQSLQQIKEMLTTEFFGDDTSTALGPKTVAIAIQGGAPKVVVGEQKTRKQALVGFLSENGPTTRGDILRKTGLPRGTIAFLLNDKNTFSRRDDGKWIVR